MSGEERKKRDGVAHALTTPTRTVTVERDEEHNRYLLQVDDRSSGYPRQHTIGVDFVTAGEYRTLLANHRDIPTLAGDIIVATSADVAEVAEDVEDVLGGGSAGAATTTTRAPRPAAKKEKPPDITLHSLDEVVEFFIAAGKK